MKITVFDIFESCCVAVVVSNAVWGCGASSPTPAQQADVARYELEQDRCIAEAKTIDESRACRAAVKAKWGRK